MISKKLINKIFIQKKKKGCCGSNKPKWKREIVPGHKLENVNLDAFYDSSCITRFSYSFVFIAFLKTICVISADLYTAGKIIIKSSLIERQNTQCFF